MAIFHHWQQYTRTLGRALARAATAAVGGTATAGRVDRGHLALEFCCGRARNDSGARRLCIHQDVLQPRIDTKVEKVRAGRSEGVQLCRTVDRAACGYPHFRA